MEFLKLTLILCALAGHALPRPQGQYECSSPADIIFILDSSASIWHGHFKQQLKFVSDVINDFDIGPRQTQTRVGVLTFGHLVWKQFDLNDIMDKKTMIETVNNIHHQGGRTTETGEAIRIAATEMFDEAAGNRKDVPDIAIVITDGRSQKHAETTIAAEKAHDLGITTFAIGVGSNLDFNELKAIASDPDSEYMFKVDGFGALSKIKDKLTRRTCQATKAPMTTTTSATMTTKPTTTEPTTTTTTEPTTTTTTEPTTTTTTEPTTTTTTTLPTTTTTLQTTTTESDPADQSQKDCGNKPAEVIFVVDSSSSINSKDFNTEIEFVKNVTNIFDIGQDKTRVGVISFSHHANIIHGLNNQLNKGQLLNKITKIKHVGGGTNSAEALNVLRRKGFAKKLVRPNVPKIAVFLTDGLSANEDRTAHEARLTHQAGIKVFAIGIGHGVDMTEIKTIASDPDDNFVFQVDDFNSLDGIKDLLAVKTCGVAPDEKPTDKPSTSTACAIEQNTDLMFIYDITALGEEKSQAIAMFLTTVVSQYDLLSGYLHVGRITDNCPSGGNFELSNKITSADFSSIRLSTFSHLIKKVIRTGFTSEYGGRENSKKVAVILIDADMDSLDIAALHEAKELSKQKNTEVFVVAMGNNHIIYKFSKSFPASRFVRMDSYTELDSAALELLTKLCNYFQAPPGGFTPQ